MPLFALFDNPTTMLILGALAVLLFGERLPEVARTFGKSLMQIKNGMRDVQNEIQSAINSTTSADSPSSQSTPSYDEPADRQEATAPKFEPPSYV